MTHTWYYGADEPFFGAEGLPCLRSSIPHPKKTIVSKLEVEPDGQPHGAPGYKKYSHLQNKNLDIPTVLGAKEPLSFRRKKNAHN